MPVRALAVAALTLLVGADAGLAQTTSPTSDPLRGERRLLPLDNIAVLHWGQQADGSFAPPVLPVLKTSQNDFLGGGALLAPEVSPPSDFGNSFGYSVGRMFAAPRDTFAVAFRQQMSIYFGPVTGQTVEPVPSVMPRLVRGITDSTPGSSPGG